MGSGHQPGSWYIVARHHGTIVIQTWYIIIFRNEKGESIQLNKLNNIENVEDVNNIEHSGQNDEPSAQNDPPAPGTSPTSPSPSPPVGVEELQRDRGQKVVAHVPPADPSRLRPVTDSQSEEEEYPINANAVPHVSPSHLPRNDSQLVTGSDPPPGSSGGTYLAGDQNDASNTHSAPSLGRAATSSNPDPILSDNRVTEVTTTHHDASNDRDAPCDLVTPEIKPTVLPKRPSQSDNTTHSPAVSGAERPCGETVQTSNTPNGLVFSIP